uniref:J domain-containing protein n=1 Tax=Clastoptera arizonana TaxID=38151 RepID=A0A1B6CML5_9HEMI
MYSILCKCYSLDILKRSFSTSENFWKSHYDCLGVLPNATQSEVKTAYYKLSKIYHPDINKGSDQAAEKFRDINNAYEVLGNVKTRRMYDKGILHDLQPSSANNMDSDTDVKETYEHARFYHSRNIPNPKVYTGARKSPIYNFDEWTQQHYGATFARRADAKSRYKDRTQSDCPRNDDSMEDYIMRSGLAATIILIFLFFMLFEDRDTVVQHKDDKNKGDIRPNY